MRKNLSVMLSAALGAGLMYLFDPHFGRRRRALLRDKAVHAAHKSRDSMDTTAHDLANRMQGMRAGVGSLMHREAEVSDRVLAERVRSRLGRYCSHPSAVEVHAEQGRVSLKGPILADEAKRLARSVRAVRGVREVDNQLEEHATAEHVPALQGRHPAVGRRFELLQSNWSPSARLVAGAAGTAGTAYGLTRRGPLGALVGLASVTLLTRAATNMDLRRMAGLAARTRRPIDIQKSIHIHAPVERVFELWSNYENLPHFMSHVQSVRRIDDRRWRWTLAGPAGAPVEWDAVTTEQRPNESLGWRTAPGSMVEHEGRAHFEPRPDGSTMVQVHMRYQPPAGVAGQMLANWLGADPRHRMDEDLMRMKTFIERGAPEREAASGS